MAGRKPIMTVRILRLEREKTGGIVNILQDEILTFAEQYGIDCIVDVAYHSGLQYIGEFKDGIHLEIYYSPATHCSLSKVDQLVKRGYSVRVIESSFPPDF